MFIFLKKIRNLNFVTALAEGSINVGIVYEGNEQVDEEQMEEQMEVGEVIEVETEYVEVETEEEDEEEEEDYEEEEDDEEEIEKEGEEEKEDEGEEESEKNEAAKKKRGKKFQLRFSPICLLCQYEHKDQGTNVCFGADQCGCVWICQECAEEEKLTEKLRASGKDKARERIEMNCLVIETEEVDELGEPWRIKFLDLPSKNPEEAEEWRKGLDGRPECMKCFARWENLGKKCRRSVRSDKRRSCKLCAGSE